MQKRIGAWVLAAAAAVTANQALAEFVWMEGENAQVNVNAKLTGWGNKQFLSDEKWMHIAFGPQEVDKAVPGEAVEISQSFEIGKGGNYHIWNRIGMEFVRSNFQWRVDEGEWKTLKSDELTTDLMNIAEWTEIAWIDMGQAQLSPGKHVLQIKVPKTKTKDGKSDKLIYASDVVCITDELFKPNGKYKPSESGRSDEDLAAEKFVFKLPAAPAGQRGAVKLAGTWEVARWDEQAPGEVAAPIADLPKDAIFRAIPVPSDKNTTRPDLVFAHRLWYRTRVEVPADMAGRSFFIDFPLNNLNTTVVVNGQQCGFFKSPFARFQIDVSKAIKPGVNEILVGIKDAWYGREADPDNPMLLRRTFNVPLGVFARGFQKLDYPVWNCPQSGILATPTFVSAGGVYASDVFVKPSVEKKQLVAEVTISNPGKTDAAGEIAWEAVDDKTGLTAKTFTAKKFSVAAGQTQSLELADAWADAKLWWPDQPNMYRLRTVVKLNGNVVDTNETLFGFREWKTQGTKFTLNGVVWHLWADLIGGKSGTKEEFLKAYRDSGVRTYRYSTAGQATQNPKWNGLEPQEALEFMSRSGVVVRRNTTLDGEVIGNAFFEENPGILKKQGGSRVRQKLMQNWIDQCVAQVKGERNHAAIQIWTIENEFAFINLFNLVGRQKEMDVYEEWITKCHDAVMAADPTRSAMIDGGGATKANTLGVHGDHYVNSMDGRYPDLAYEPNTKAGGRGRWEWDMKRPRFIGEDFYAAGYNPPDYAIFGGEIAFQGKAAIKESIATVYRMLQEGYRWGGHYAAWHFWVGGEGGARSRLANAPRAVFSREWDWTFGSGAKVTRTFGVFNDSQYAEPISFTRVLTVGGKELLRKTTQHDVKPGTAQKFQEELTLPQVSDRTEGELVLTLSAGGKEIFRDVKQVSVLAPAKLDATVPSGAVALWDPKGRIGEFLKSANVSFTPVNSLEALSDSTKLLIVGSDALSAEESTSTALSAYASKGHAVIVLDQENRLKYAGLPAEMDVVAPKAAEEMDPNAGRTAFIEDASHPALAGLKDKDFFTWTGDHVVYRLPYVKPTRGGKSLLQVGGRLSQTALAELPVGKGVMYVSQLEFGEKVASNPVAQRVLLNLVKQALTFKQEFAQVSAAVSNEQLGKALDAIGLQYSKAGDVLAAISDSNKSVAIISATPQNLKTLASNMPRLQAFWARGGQIFLHDVTPEGLADFNKIVGVNHMIRPFGRIKVTFPPTRNPLTAGLPTGDIVMQSGKKIFGWTADEYVASDVFTNIVDLDDVAPFGKSDFPSYGNITNGFINTDGWPLIIDFPAPENGKPFDINIELPNEQEIKEFVFDPSTNYGQVKSVALIFDNGNRQEFALDGTGDAQTFAVEPPQKAKKVTLQLAKYELAPGKAPNIGIDNINLRVNRSQEFQQTVRPMLNLGGMVQYVKGNGGVVLCNLNLQENEAVPANKIKKQSIIATVLRNMKAPFAGGKTVIAGAHLNYQPLEISSKATTFKNEKGWYGDAKHTFADLPQGTHVFAGVKYDIYEMPTSPVPQVLMLGAKGLPGNPPTAINDIPVNTKADALFFLHTAKVNKRPTDKQRQEKKQPAMFKYVIKYADGQTVEVPVRPELEIENYMQKEPAALPGAQLGWSQPFEKDPAMKTAAYSMQWNNPRPEIEIKSVDMLYVDQSMGIPVLLSLTAAKAEQ